MKTSQKPSGNVLLIYNPLTSHITLHIMLSLMIIFKQLCLTLLFLHQQKLIKSLINSGQLLNGTMMVKFLWNTFLTKLLTFQLT